MDITLVQSFQYNPDFKAAGIVHMCKRNIDVHETTRVRNTHVLYSKIPIKFEHNVEITCRVGRRESVRLQ